MPEPPPQRRKTLSQALHEFFISVTVAYRHLFWSRQVTTLALGPAAAADTSVAIAISSAHDQWFEQVHTHVGPATDSGADFWDRWSAARYLNDEFVLRFRLEWELLSSMTDVLESKAEAQLIAQAARIERVRARIARNGGRRGTGAIVSDDVATLVRDLWGWCARIERAVADVGWDILPPRAQRLLDRLVAYERPATAAPAEKLFPHPDPWRSR
ncbi:MAG: hypothetical protein ABI766_09655 [Gemmatimonadales bacterium]